MNQFSASLTATTASATTASLQYDSRYYGATLYNVYFSDAQLASLSLPDFLSVQAWIPSQSGKYGAVSVLQQFTTYTSGAGATALTFVVSAEPNAGATTVFYNKQTTPALRGDFEADNTGIAIPNSLDPAQIDIPTINIQLKSDAIDEELQKRGISSIQQAGAEDLKYIKEQIVQKLSVQTDPQGKPVKDPTTGEFARTAWYDDYLDSDGSKTNRVISGLSKIINDEDFMTKSGNGKKVVWKSVSAYLQIRKAIAEELVKRDVKSIDAKANIDLKYIYDATVNKLKNDDKLGFAYLYDRFLSQDLVYLF